MATRVLRTVLPGIFLAIPLTSLSRLVPFLGPESGPAHDVRWPPWRRPSVWHDALMDMGARWREVSGGKVNLQIIPSGQGGRKTMSSEG